MQLQKMKGKFLFAGIFILGFAFALAFLADLLPRINTACHQAQLDFWHLSNGLNLFLKNGGNVQDGIIDDLEFLVNKNDSSGIG